MPKKINFIIKQDKVEKKIFKLFADKLGDLYISFPYFNSKQYNCGIGCFPAGVNELTFNPIANGTESRIPVSCLTIMMEKFTSNHSKPQCRA